VILTIIILVLLLAACWPAGQAVLMLAGIPAKSWLAPVCGFAVLISLNAGAVHLPGRGATALAATLILVAAAVALVVRRGRPRASAALIVAAGAAVLTAALMCIPFIVNGRFGLIGQSVGDDLGSHYAIVASLQQGFKLPQPPRSAGYPIGIHSLVAAVSTGIGDINQGFTAVMILIPVLTAIVAVGMLRDEPPIRRLLASTLVGIPYLTAAFFAQNAFKEMADGLFVLSIAAALTEVTVRARSPRAALVVGVLSAGAVQVTGYPAIGWVVGGCAIWVVLWLAVEHRLPRRDDIRAAASRLQWGLGGMLVLLLPSIGRVVSFNPIEAATAGNSHFLGYYFHNISIFEAFGIWPIGDFRYFPTITNTFYIGVLMGGVGLLLILCLRWWLSDRSRLAVPAVLGAATLIYAYARHTQGPYLNAKPLAAMAPLLMLVLIRPILANARARPIISLDGAAGRIALVGFALLAGYCTLDVLDDARVGPLQRTDDLMRLRPLVKGHATLFLPEDHYVAWELAGTKLSVLQIWSIPSEVPVTPRQPVIGTPVGFNAVEPSTLNDFEYVITTRTEAQSEPPPNWHLVANTQWYSLYHRVGPTLPREALPLSASMPGATLECNTPAGAKIAHAHGIAAVRVRPTYGSGWGGGTSGTQTIVIAGGQATTQRLEIPAGTFELSLQYQSQVPLVVSSSAGQTFREPAYLGAYGSFWRVGDLHGRGPITITVTAQQSPVHIVPRTAILGTLIALPVGTHDREIPLDRACGQYVDWYRED
jgi:hypothetical protein